MSKYKPLQVFLTSQIGSDVTLTFAKIEEILNARLPKSAHTYREWWSNQADSSNRPQANSWMSAGFMVESLQQSGVRPWVRFHKRKP